MVSGPGPQAGPGAGATFQLWVLDVLGNSLMKCNPQRRGNLVLGLKGLRTERDARAVLISRLIGVLYPIGSTIWGSNI